MTEQEKNLAEASKRVSEIAELNVTIPESVVYGILLGDIPGGELDEYIKARKKVKDFERKYLHSLEPNVRGWVF